jgi:hypothetical protein
MLSVAASTLPLWASIVITLAAPAVAIVALIIGNKQQAKTLNQARDQHTATLKQQDDQQGRMLRHERQLDDLREVRSVLDDAAVALAKADDSRRDFIGDYHNKTKRQAVGEAGKRLDELQPRLAVRFGREHEVATSFARCSDALLRLFAATVFEDDIDRENVKIAHESFSRYRAAFVDAATARAGVELDAPP